MVEHEEAGGIIVKVVIEAFVRRGGSLEPAKREYVQEMGDALSFLLKKLEESGKISDVTISEINNGKIVLLCDERGLNAIKACLLFLQEEGKIRVEGIEGDPEVHNRELW
ncbi:MAG: hypothetical protein QXK42_02845 [Candidatus Korarchaeum sp.]